MTLHSSDQVWQKRAESKQVSATKKKQLSLDLHVDTNATCISLHLLFHPWNIKSIQLLDGIIVETLKVLIINKPFLPVTCTYMGALNNISEHNSFSLSSDRIFSHCPLKECFFMNILCDYMSEEQLNSDTYLAADPYYLIINLTLRENNLIADKNQYAHFWSIGCVCVVFVPLGCTLHYAFFICYIDL